jgi:TATA-box binding protein (TBP) (component of TFIID and TFIIIB)
MLDTNLTVPPEKLHDVYENMKIIPYFTNEEGVIKVTLRGLNKGFCKKTIYKKNKAKNKVLKKTFQNQLSLYIRVFEEKKIKILNVLKDPPTYQDTQMVAENSPLNVYEFKKGQTAFQYNKIIITYDLENLIPNTEIFIKVKSIVNRKSIPDTIVLDIATKTPKTPLEKNELKVEYDLNIVGFSNCVIFESSVPILEVHFNYIIEVNMFVFTSGKIKVAGCTSHTQITKAMSRLVDNVLDDDEPKIFEIKKSDFEIQKISPVMINSDFENYFEVKKLFELDELMRKKYQLISSYEPCTHPAVIIKYYCNNSYADISGRCLCRDLYDNKHFCAGKGDCTEKGGCKTVTILVFQSGKVIITGGRLLYQVNLAYNFIKNVLKENEALLKQTKIRQ